MEALFPYRMMAAAIVLSAMFVSGTYRRRARRAGGPVSRSAEGGVPAVVLRVFGSLAWLSMLLYIVHPEWIGWARVSLPDWVRSAGVLLAAVSVPLAWWMFHSLGLNVTDTVATRRDHELVTRGPYRWIRHPLYSFGGLMFVGLALLSANAFVAASGAGALALLVRRTSNEEAHLAARFGEEYAAYKERTGRFVPRLG